MCRPKRCATCGLTTWTGCGAHVADVKASVPPGQWCAGHPDAQGSTSWVKRLLGR
ncbi:hypothetical protein [Nocardioides sp. GXZ039]|uniref:hypothetical protein n=1 Tax=Nocardioides sp. GXZ039 TaxID=3136018 RepID=UPI0030F3F062